MKTILDAPPADCMFLRRGICHRRGVTNGFYGWQKFIPRPCPCPENPAKCFHSQNPAHAPRKETPDHGNL